MADEDKFLFLSGNPRSGTTLLELIVSSHREISISPETVFLEKAFTRFPHNRELSSEEMDRLKAIIKNDPKLTGWKTDMGAFRDRLDSRENATVKSIIIDLLTCYRDAAAPGASFLGNKKEFYVDYADAVLDLFPRAKFIFIVRDARDVAVSIRDNFSEKYSPWSTGISWNRRVGRGGKLCSRLPKSCLEVRYEDLTENPERICRKICDFLSLDYTDSMLDYHRNNKGLEKIVKGKEKIHKYTSRPVNTGRTQRWKKELSEEDIRIIENVASRQMKRLGYERHFSGCAPVSIKLKGCGLSLMDKIKWYRIGKKVKRETGTV